MIEREFSIMDIFNGILESFTLIPAWVTLVLLPSLFLAYAVLVTLFGGRASYPFVAIAGCAAAFVLLSPRDLSAACAFTGLFALYAAFLRLLLIFPRPERARAKRTQTKKTEQAESVSRKSAIVPREKRCAFEEPAVSPEQCGMRLVHAEEMLAKLRRAPLTAADRLEVDTLVRTVAAYRTKALTEPEIAHLNDSLAAVLKLMAKYKI